MRIKPTLIIASDNVHLKNSVLLLRKRLGPEGDYTHAISLNPTYKNIVIENVWIYSTCPKYRGIKVAFKWLWHIKVLKKPYYWIEPKKSNKP